MSHETMKWTILLVIAALLVVVFLMKKTGDLSSEDASEYLKEGAVVIDVRSPGEYNAEHLRGTLNIPLDVVESAVPQRLGDKDQVLLLHCQSGVRSGMAVRKLKALGYTKVFNLGSFNRAKEIVAKAGNP